MVAPESSLTCKVFLCRLNRSTARFASSMSAHPILAVQNHQQDFLLVYVGGQGWGCSPIKRVRELGSERCEAVCLITTGDVGYLKGRTF